MESLSLKIEQYEGPLDLLLALISKQKINIFDIPISAIAEQYLQYIESMRVLNMEVTSDFIAMAAELMLIKSKLLLPQKEGEEDPRQPLVDALLEHQRAVQAAVFLKKQSDLFYDRFIKEPDEGDGIYMREHAVTLLQEAFMRIAERKETTATVSENKLFEKIEHERYYSVDEKIFSVMRILARQERCLFENIFVGSKSRSEIIAVFLAVLETVRKGRVGVIRNKSEIYLTLIRDRT